MAAGKKIILFTLLILLLGCVKEITSFEECAAAGNAIMESYPEQCRSGDKTFVRELSPEEQAKLQPPCEDLCGDGICQEFVCMSIGCPCAETAETCPVDCKE